MTAVPDRSIFENIYARQTPLEIGRPQKAILGVAYQTTGSILDAGRGTGENALYFAGRGQKVTGIDFLAEPITRAQKKAAERGVLRRAAGRRGTVSGPPVTIAAQTMNAAAAGRAGVAACHLKWPR